MSRYEFHFDFGSPNAYLVQQILPGIAQRTGITFDYIPVLLGGIFKATNNQSPAVSLQGISNKPEYQQLEMDRFMRKHSITRFQFNPHFPVNTLQLMRGAVVAKADGMLDAYIKAVLVHMWEEPKKMDDPEVIRTALNNSGLNGDALLERTQDPAIKQRLIANTEDSVARGAFGIPTFFVDGEIYFGKDRLREVEEAIEAGK